MKGDQVTVCGWFPPRRSILRVPSWYGWYSPPLVSSVCFGIKHFKSDKEEIMNKSNHPRGSIIFWNACFIIATGLAMVALLVWSFSLSGQASFP
jgi:hypothetical protein